MMKNNSVISNILVLVWIVMTVMMLCSVLPHLWLEMLSSRSFWFCFCYQICQHAHVQYNTFTFMHLADYLFGLNPTLSYILIYVIYLPHFPLQRMGCTGSGPLLSKSPAARQDRDRYSVEPTTHTQVMLFTHTHISVRAISKRYK